MKQKISLTSQKEQKIKNWVEPLREWIKTSNEADFLSKSNDFHKIKEIFQKIGTNRYLSDKRVLIDFSDPWLITAQFRQELRPDTPLPVMIYHNGQRDSSTENLTCFRLSGRRDLNPESHEPESCVLPLHYVPFIRNIFSFFLSLRLQLLFLSVPELSLILPGIFCRVHGFAS